MSFLIPIFLLHGLGSHTLTLQPLKIYLNYVGYDNIHLISYPVDRLELNESIDYVDQEMIKYANKKINNIIIVGQSMGGVVANNLHKKGWNIQKTIYIGSPLHGANLLNQLEQVLPTFIKDYFYKKPYDILKNKEKEIEPPHDYKTISMGWFNSEFDGCVYKNETILNPENHIHLSWADHRTIFANPRLWKLVRDLINE